MKTIEDILIEHNNKVIKKALEQIRKEILDKPIMTAAFDDFISIYDVITIIDKHIKELNNEPRK